LHHEDLDQVSRVLDELLREHSQLLSILVEAVSMYDATARAGTGPNFSGHLSRIVTVSDWPWLCTSKRKSQNWMSNVKAKKL
jgi:hypothetical protein